MKRARIALFSVIGAALLFVASIPFAMPQAAAYACPSCYGFEQIAEGIYAEADQAHPDLLETIAASKVRVRRAFGIEELPTIRVLACGSDACDHRLGGRGAKARAYGNRFILLSPEGRTEEFVSHEYAHIVLHDHIGSLGLLRSDLPAWKNEGIAVLVSGDTRFFSRDDAGHGCTVEPDGPLPATASAWGKAMRPDTYLALYSQAACMILRKYGPPPYDLETLLQGNG